MSCEQNSPVVGIIMGSESDMPAMEPCMKQLDEFGVPYEVKVASAHRKPAEVHEWASTAHERGIRVIVAAAGKAAHLGGVVAAYTPNPVITVPMKTSDLGGLDSLLSMVQMPSGVPVACVAINGAKNAAILAVQILGTGCDGARQKIIDFKQSMADALAEPRARVPHLGSSRSQRPRMLRHAGAYNFLNILQHFPRRRHVRGKEAVSG